MHDSAKQFYDSFDVKDIELLCSYLEKRCQRRRSSSTIGVVFDVLHSCMLHCKGCGTNATIPHDLSHIPCALSLNQIDNIFSKLKEYGIQNDKSIFLNIGGGEPFLRKDIIDLLRLASDYFGSSNVGIDTSAVMNNAELLISEAMPYVSYVGVSINGLKEYHNWWTDNNRIDAFSRTISTVHNLCTKPAFCDKIEVTSVATKKNMDELPDLMKYLSSIGVKKYSVHRAIPVGRMLNHLDLVPDARDYLQLLLALISSSSATGMDFHIHHSIESIHAALLLGIDTYHHEHIGNPDSLSSIGIDPEGNIVFDPWCTTSGWSSLSSGNIVLDSRKLDDIFKDSSSVFRKANEYTSFFKRCNGCDISCSGGSRIVAASYELFNNTSNSIHDSDYYEAMSAVDPACPLYYLSRN